jgi:DNA-binding MarR family transcriptional regulator
LQGIGNLAATSKDRALNQTTLSRTNSTSYRKGGSNDVAIDSLAAFLSMPGYLIRRSKQTSTFIFTETCKDFGITPIQFAAMAILRFRPGIDQTELGEIAALDPSTAGDVIQRLERRELLQREEQGQRRLCNLTAEGLALLEKVSPLVVAAQSLVLDALTSREQTQLLRLMSKMNGVSNLHHTAHKMRRRRRRLVSEG